MKRIILLIGFAAFMQAGVAQVLLNLQLPASGIYLKTQLWNLSVINTGVQNINVKIEMTFTDISNNQRVFTASSRLFILSQQVTQLQASDLAPVLYNIVNNSYNVDVNPNGFLPVGQFEVCFAVMKSNGETFDKLTEECETIEIEPVSPPILIEPGNEENIDELRPFFTWLPPSPATGFYNLNYDWLLVEVLGTQNAGDAIQQNIAVYSQEDISVNSILYPSSLPELDTIKTYAWQVAAKSSNNAISKSEIFTFRVRKYGLDSSLIISTGYFVPLKRENDAAYTNTTGLLRYEYLNEINDSTAFIRIDDITGTLRNVLTVDTAFVELKFGQNFIETNFSDLPGLINKHVYLFTLLNSKEEKWYFKFQYIKPENN